MTVSSNQQAGGGVEYSNLNDARGSGLFLGLLSAWAGAIPASLQKFAKKVAQCWNTGRPSESDYREGLVLTANTVTDACPVCQGLGIYRVEFWLYGADTPDFEDRECDVCDALLCQTVEEDGAYQHHLAVSEAAEFDAAMGRRLRSWGDLAADVLSNRLAGVMS